MPAPKKKKLPSRTKGKKTETLKKTIKKPVVAVVKEKNIRETTNAGEKREKFIYSVGRRKSSIARVRYYPSRDWGFVMNKKSFESYFVSPSLRSIINGPLEIVDLNKKGQFSVRVAGGGSKSQALSVRLGISRILLQIDATNRTILKKAGFLTRDPRVKERKKYGLRGARRAPQWQKR